MRPSTYSLDSLRLYFKDHTIATMEQLKTVLGTAVDMTVYRKLQQLNYLTSYSHQGRYYTLRDLARFNSFGLWWHQGVRFSQHGTLINTVQELVSTAESGYTLAELRQMVGCEVKETLLTLVKQNRIQREEQDPGYIYFATAPAKRREQQLGRMLQGPSPHVAGSPDVLPHEIRAAILLFLSLLDEKQRRIYAGLESLRIGQGGDAAIARLLGLDPHTVAKGRQQLLDRDLEIDRVRRQGGGRPVIKKNSANN
jgi:hypothetical protein